MPTPLPRTIVIPSAAYRFVLGQLARELWDDKRWKELKAMKGDPWEKLTTDDLYWQTDATKRLLLERLPQRRRELLQRWPADLALLFAQRMQSDNTRAGTHPTVRVSAASFESWLLGEPDFECPAEAPEADAERVAKLATMRGYDDWLAAGGDAEVGRLLGLWAESFYAEPSSD